MSKKDYKILSRGGEYHILLNDEIVAITKKLHYARVIYFYDTFISAIEICYTLLTSFKQMKMAKGHRAVLMSTTKELKKIIQLIHGFIDN